MKLKLDAYICRKVEQAIEESRHPKGMHLSDGKAIIDANILERLLVIAKQNSFVNEVEEQEQKK